MGIAIIAAAFAVVICTAFVFDRKAKARGRGNGDLGALDAARDGSDASMSHAQLSAQSAIGEGLGGGGLGGLG